MFRGEQHGRHKQDLPDQETKVGVATALNHQDASDAIDDTKILSMDFTTNRESFANSSFKLNDFFC